MEGGDISGLEVVIGNAAGGGGETNDDDDCFYIVLFSTLEQTHCARM